MSELNMEPLVYILDDDPIMAESISWMVETIGIKVKKYNSTEELFKNFNKDQHGCLLLDIRMPDMTGIAVQTKLKEMGATLPIIFISACDDIAIAVRVIKNGAFDFLTKPFNDYALLESINNALNLDKINRKAILNNTQTKFKLSQLSPRELQVLQGIVDGKQNKSISAQLNISLKTIEAHRASLMKKMGVKSVSGLVKLALSQDIQPTDINQ